MSDELLLATSSANMSDLPTFIQPAGGDPDLFYSGVDMRSLTYLAVGRGPGVATPSGMTLSASGSGRTMNISAGYAIVPVSTDAYGGCYIVRSTGTDTLTFDANASGSTNNYAVFVEVLDKFYSGSLYTWQYFAKESTGGAAATTAATLRAAGRNIAYLGTVAITNGLATLTSAQISLATKEYAYGGTAWPNPDLTLLTGWTNYGGVYSPARYRRDPGGVVHLEGLVVAATGVTGSATPICTLPVGFRPTLHLIFSVYSNTAGGGIATGFGSIRVDVETDGNVYAFVDPGGTGAVHVSLSGITFGTM